MAENVSGGELVPESDASDAVTSTWNILTQNPTGQDFRVLCERCPFLDVETGSCNQDKANKDFITIYQITNQSGAPRMSMGFESMMKSFEQARSILENNPSLRKDPEGGEVSIDEALRFSNDKAVKIWRRKQRIARLFRGQEAAEWVEHPTWLEAKGTSIGIEVMSQVVRLNCARVNRARVDNQNLADQIARGEVWTVSAEDLLNLDDLR